LRKPEPYRQTAGILSKDVDFARGDMSVTQPSDVRHDYTTHPKSARQLGYSFLTYPFENMNILTDTMVQSVEYLSGDLREVE